MVNTETVRESVVIRVDFVRAGEARTSEPASGGAKIIDINEARLARCTVEPRPALPPRLPRGGAPGRFGGPF